nr:ribonuclease H-like domain-containing protein [Tanacetum cinerariifolium]
VAMISMRIKKFYKRTCRKLQFDTKDPVGFDKTKVKCFNCHKWGILLETAELKGTNTAEEEMMGTMEPKLKTMVEDLHIWMIQKLWLPLMEKILTGLDMLRKMLKTML